MSLLKSLTTDESIKQETDSLGGNGGPLDSGLYTAKVQTAYTTKSAGGAIGLVLNLKTEAGREIRQTLWMTSGTAKGCKNYYEDKQGQKQYLPGFILANHLALLTCDKEISELDTETKVTGVWSSDAKAEVPTKVDMIMDMLGKNVTIGLIKQIVDKTAKDGNGDYQPTGETREENEIDKFFHTDTRKTVTELRAKADAAFIDAWDQKWSGKVKERAKGVAAAGVAGAPKAAGAAGTKKPTTSLFG
jgi:hypothetical protein